MIVTMKLKQIGTNCHELMFANGNSVLFSYETAVAVALAQPISGFMGVYRTSEKYSKTTTSHINAWTATTKTLPHEEFLALVNAAISHR